MSKEIKNIVDDLEDKYDLEEIKHEIIKRHNDELITDNESIIVRLLEFIGEDPKREGLLETPRRVLKAWREWTQGYNQDPAKVFKCFEDGSENYDTLVILDGIPVHSHCEHHLARIEGVCHIGYIPNKKVAGLSKFVRLVNIFAHRLQVQERLTTQIADAIQEYLNPLGCGVIIKASHACMSSRGVRADGILTTTSALRGVMLEPNNNSRIEFLNLINSK